MHKPKNWPPLIMLPRLTHVQSMYTIRGVCLNLNMTPRPKINLLLEVKGTSRKNEMTDCGETCYLACPRQANAVYLLNYTENLVSASSPSAMLLARKFRIVEATIAR